MTTCRQCGNPIVGRRSDAIYCSDPCGIKGSTANRRQRRGTKATERICIVCGKPFRSQRSNHVRCSRACAIKYFTRLRRERREQPEAATAAVGKGTGVCAWCGGPANVKRIFCSRDCQEQHGATQIEAAGPTPDEITRLCNEIKATWTDHEWERRAKLLTGPDVLQYADTAPVIRRML